LTTLNTNLHKHTHTHKKNSSALHQGIQSTKNRFSILRRIDLTCQKTCIWKLFLRT